MRAWQPPIGHSDFEQSNEGDRSGSLSESASKSSDESEGSGEESNDPVNLKVVDTICILRV